MESVGSKCRFELDMVTSESTCAFYLKLDEAEKFRRSGLADGTVSSSSFVFFKLEIHTSFGR